MRLLHLQPGCSHQSSPAHPHPELVCTPHKHTGLYMASQGTGQAVEQGRGCVGCPDGGARGGGVWGFTSAPRWGEIPRDCGERECRSQGNKWVPRAAVRMQNQPSSYSPTCLPRVGGGFAISGERDEPREDKSGRGMARLHKGGG